MEKKVYTGYYAGHPVRYRFRNERTHLYFGTYLELTEGYEPDILMNDDHFEECRDLLNKEPPEYVEFKGMISLTSRYLLRYHCCIFHSVSFVYKDKAWLLSAPSGTGKTTQYMNLKKMYPDEITMISGDMPLLEVKENQIYVHHSPWNGKEGIGNQITAPLGGVICLKQGEENIIKTLTPHEGIIPVLREFRTITETNEEMISMTEMAGCMFRNYPVWLYTNTGDCESSEILKNHLEESLK